MARLLDERFKAAGYDESWTEVVGVGCSLTENTLVSSMSAGSSAPSTLGLYICEMIKPTALVTVYGSKFLSSGYSTLYGRVEFYVNSISETDNNFAPILTIKNSVAGTLFRIRLRYSAGTTRIANTFVDSNATTVSFSASIVLLNTWNRYEFYYNSFGPESFIQKLNGSITDTYVFTSGGTLVKNIKEIRFGSDNAENAGLQVYFDNIRINDNTGDTDNTWPGNNYSNPSKGDEFLSTMGELALEL